ncbi:MAG: hypothetical protein GX340_07210 [Clostridiales bacterium]|jgi:hypothetical protein|nr:hypothetical protein [Clostridiales bacterium]
MTLQQFNPEEHLTKLPLRRRNPKTNSWETRYVDYLEVKWRMVWFRENNSENTQTTVLDKIIDINNRFAYFEIQVTDTKGNVEVGVGSETGEDFHDYIEKAYTKAYGRALAALGYGTQFAPDLEEGDRIADSPVARSDETSDESSAQDEAITDPQRRAIFAIYNSINLTEEEMKDIILSRYQKVDSKALTKREASDLIDYLNHLKEIQ